MHRTNLRNLFVISVTATLFYLAVQAFRGGECWSVLLVVVLVAWPIWRYQSDDAHFRRRAYLESVATRRGRLRRWFWKGRVSETCQVLIALGWSAVLLAFGALLEPHHWGVVAVISVLLALIIRPITRCLVRDVKPRRLHIAARRWPLWLISVAMLTVGFMLVDFLIGVPDTRALAWTAVPAHAFNEVSESFTCDAAGALVGALAAADRLAWHAYQLVVPNLPGQILKIAAWSTLLLSAGLLSIAFTRFQLGAVALFGRRSRALNRVIGETPLSRAFVGTIFVLALLVLFASTRIQDIVSWADLPPQEPTVVIASPCATDGKQADALRAKVSGEIDGWRSTAKGAASDSIQRELDQIFAEVESGVDRYLDWYFTLAGEYERLVVAVAGDFSAFMLKELDRRLFTPVGGIPLAERIGNISDEITAKNQAQLAIVAKNLGLTIGQEGQADQCLTKDLDLTVLAGALERDWERALASSGTGAAVGVTVSVVAGKGAASVAGKVAGKKGFQAGAALLGKLAAKKAGSVLAAGGAATLACAPTGPFAVLCGIGAGLVTWIVVDKVLIEIDEARLRPEMRAEILDAVSAHRRELQGALETAHHLAIDQNAVAVSAELGRVFKPVRDGL